MASPPPRARPAARKAAAPAVPVESAASIEARVRMIMRTVKQSALANVIQEMCSCLPDLQTSL